MNHVSRFDLWKPQYGFRKLHIPVILGITLALYGRYEEKKKRDFVFDRHGKWVGTKPIHVGEGDVNSLNPTSNKLIKSLLEQNEDLRIELANSDRLKPGTQNIKDSSKKKASKKKSDNPDKKAE